jgi:PhnB protein
MTGIAPWLSVTNATDALAFYTAAFGAIELERLDEGGDVVLAQLSIDGADFWIQTDAESTPEALHGRSVRMILTVEDPDSVFARAVAAGAIEVAPVSDDYGWRIGRVADPCGHHWEIGRRLAT